MTLGIVCGGINFLYSKDNVGLYFKFLPQIIFFSSIFGYMDFLILYKWLHSWKNPPSIINTMIEMFLTFGETSNPFFGG